MVELYPARLGQVENNSLRKRDGAEPVLNPDEELFFFFTVWYRNHSQAFIRKLSQSKKTILRLPSVISTSRSISM